MNEGPDSSRSDSSNSSNSSDSSDSSDDGNTKGTCTKGTCTESTCTESICTESTCTESTCTESIYGGGGGGCGVTSRFLVPKDIKLTEQYIKPFIGSTTKTFITNDIIGLYILLYKIGDGTYGDVWKAWHIKTKEIVAIKIQCNKKENKDYANYVVALNEIKMLDMFKSCPYIVHMIEAFYIESIIFIVLEYCHNTITTEIHNILRTRPNMTVIQKIEIVKPWIKKLLSALSFINTFNVIHLDIKPANILIDSIGDIKLCDFGMTVYIKNIELGDEYTSIWYRAPETNQLYMKKKINI